MGCVANGAGIDHGGPAHDQRLANAAFVQVPLAARSGAFEVTGVTAAPLEAQPPLSDVSITAVPLGNVQLVQLFQEPPDQPWSTLSTMAA